MGTQYQDYLDNLFPIELVYFHFGIMNKPVLYCILLYWSIDYTFIPL